MRQHEVPELHNTLDDLCSAASQFFDDWDEWVSVARYEKIDPIIDKLLLLYSAVRADPHIKTAQVRMIMSELEKLLEESR